MRGPTNSTGKPVRGPFEAEAYGQHEYAEYYAQMVDVVGERAVQEVRERDAKCAYFEAATNTLQAQLSELYHENRAVVTEANERILSGAQYFAKK